MKEQTILAACLILTPYLAIAADKPEVRDDERIPATRDAREPARTR